MKKIPPILILGMVWLVAPKRALATLGCSIAINPDTVAENSSSQVNVTLSNTGDESLNWMRIWSGNTEVWDFDSVSSTGWTYSEAVLQGGSVSAASDMTILLGIVAQASENTTDLHIEVSADSGGSSGECANAPSLTVVAGAAAAPQISNINLTVGNSSATVTWSTDLSATGVVNYGTTSGYGSSTTTASGTTHSATMGSLSASTTYHYQITVTGEGGSRSTADATFTTSAASVTTTTTTTVTNTVTSTSTVNKTIVLADTVKPVVKVTTKLDKPVAQPPIIEGKVVDSGAVNVGIVKIQYSTDNGKSWLLVDEPSGASTTEFSFVPEVYDDGNYQLLVRATDKSGNTGISSAQTLIIDRLPPRIIHSLFRVGPIILSSPYMLALGTQVSVSVSGVGGVTTMELLVGSQQFSLIKNVENGLWEGEIVLTEAGQYDVISQAVDGGGSEVKQTIASATVAQAGGVMPVSTEMSVYRFDPLTGRYQVWNGGVYGQENPSQNRTNWYLPPGTYYVEGKSSGYFRSQSQLFTLAEPGIVGVAGELTPFSLWGWLSRGELRIQQAFRVTDTSDLIGKQISWLEGTEWRGREIRLTILPSWDPRLPQVLSALADDSVVVVPGSNDSSVELLKSRGHYSAELVADPDGEILHDLGGSSLPITLFLNRRGQVERVE